ncbi:hypothetical protein [Streptomyces sp. enrichment culture]|uniref:hypothetical protein n=1 Tax=Streptomyces sp. enrichment culture TaxID=1795815 RepID=UPI003F553BC2
MGAHAAPARHRRGRRPRPGTDTGPAAGGPGTGADRRTTLSWAIPAALAAVYALYAGFLHRGEGPTDWGDVVFGLVAGLVFGTLCYALGRGQRALPRETRAFAYGALGGIAIGLLRSLAGGSLLTSAVIGLIVGAAIGVAAFYVFYTHE